MQLTQLQCCEFAAQLKICVRYFQRFYDIYFFMEKQNKSSYASEFLFVTTLYIS